MKLTKDFFTAPMQRQLIPTVPSHFFTIHAREIFTTETKFDLSDMSSPYYCICHILSGSAIIVPAVLDSDLFSHTLKPGSTILISPDTIFQIIVEERSEICFLLFSGQLTASYFPEVSVTGKFLIVEQTLLSYTNQLSLLLRETQRTLPSEMTPDLLIYWEQKELTELLTYLRFSAQLPANRRSVSVPVYLKKAKQYIDEHYALSFHLEEVAALSGVSKYKLCHDFTEYYCQPPLKYVNEIRIQHAKIYLKTLDIPIHEIGSMVGIDNTNHFIHLFKRHTGMTPHLYRQSII